MASDFAASVGAAEVGSVFVQQYYSILQQQPQHAHHFYNDSSSLKIVDGSSIQSASTSDNIHDLIVSLEFSDIEIKTINSDESWNRGVFLVVSGSVKCKNSSARRKFVQSFFLAPQEKGYFVLNDVFNLLDDEAINPVLKSGVLEVASELPTPILAENGFDTPSASPPAQETPGVSDGDAVEEESGTYGDSIHIVRDDTIEDYRLREQHSSFQDLKLDTNSVHETVGSISEMPSDILRNTEEAAQETLSLVEDPVGDASKPSYASILRAARGQSTQTVRVVQSGMAPQQPLPKSNPLQKSKTVHNTTEDVTNGSVLHREGYSKSIYARNLPSSVSTLEVLEEFKHFGRVKQDGVYLVNKDVGGCYAFVEFEDVQSAQSAVKASPIKFAGSGRQVYVEMRKSNGSNGSRGGRTYRGRGRGAHHVGGGRAAAARNTDFKPVGSNGFREA